QRWVNEMIPKLLDPYMHLLRTTKNLSSEPSEHQRPCTCGNVDGRVLAIVVVRMCSLEQIQLAICACHPAPVLVVDRGLFPCAPLHPTLAVDIRHLDFVTRYFLRTSPN
ncbi:hypothetical protein BDP27DRAFT_1148168, partial [Rhodocollybia butyracea]